MKYYKRKSENDEGGLYRTDDNDRGIQAQSYNKHTGISSWEYVLFSSSHVGHKFLGELIELSEEELFLVLI